MATGRFQTNLSDYPPGDYGSLTRAAADAYGVGTDELVVGAGADEILDLCAKAFLPANGVAIVPTPTYAMYRVVTEQRAGPPGRHRPEAGHRGVDDGRRRDPRRRPCACRRRPLLWLCDPNNPTGTQEPEGAIARLLDDLAADADADDRQPPMVVLDNAYAEFAGPPLQDLRHRYSNLVVVRTASKAYALAGLRVGFAIATAGTARRLARYRPPGSISTVSATVVTEAFLDPTEMRANVERLTTERPRLAAALAAAGWRPGPSVTNFLLLDFGSAERAAAVAEALLRRGLVPRTFGAGHPLAHCLRVTVREPRRGRSPHRRGPRDRARARAPERGGHGMTTTRGALRSVAAAPRTAEVQRATRETDITVRLTLDGQGVAEHRDRHRVLRPPADLARPSRAVRPRDRGPGRSPRRRAPHGRGRGARAG